MISRTIYSFDNLIKHRKGLLAVIKRNSVASVHLINISKTSSILALDFDGVLAPHGYSKPVEATATWLKEAVTSGRYRRVYIYSNKPTEARKTFFAELTPEIQFISNLRKKPYPDGLRHIAEIEGVTPSEIVMVDDRLLTGILAAIIAGTSKIYISQPLKDYSFNTVAEIFFTILRFSEIQLIKLLGRI